MEEKIIKHLEEYKEAIKKYPVNTYMHKVLGGKIAALERLLQKPPKKGGK